VNRLIETTVDPSIEPTLKSEMKGVEMSHRQRDWGAVQRASLLAARPVNKTRPVYDLSPKTLDISIPYTSTCVRPSFHSHGDAVAFIQSFRHVPERDAVDRHSTSAVHTLRQRTQRGRGPFLNYEESELQARAPNGC